MCHGCGPSKYSPEYYAKQKPENHAGCCGKCCQESKEIKKKRKVKLGCFVRYRTISG